MDLGIGIDTGVHVLNHQNQHHRGLHIVTTHGTLCITIPDPFKYTLNLTQDLVNESPSMFRKVFNNYNDSHQAVATGLYTYTL